MNAFELFRHSLRESAGSEALVCGMGTDRRSLTFNELDKQIDSIAMQLGQSGLGPGDKVLLAVPVSMETYIVMLALMKAGMVIMFIDPAHSATRVAAILRSWPPAAIVSTKTLLLLRFLMPELRRIPRRLVVDGCLHRGHQLSFENAGTVRTAVSPRSSADSALLTFTSGSTGEPKAVLRTHGFLKQQMNMLNKIADVREDDIDYVAMPMFVLFNLANSVRSIIPACNMKQPGQAAPELVFSQMEAEKTTRIVASPALLERLADHCLRKRTRLPCMRCISTGGGPVSPTLARKLKRISPDAVIRMVYGSTEAEPIASIDDTEVSVTARNRMQQGSGLLVGKPVDGCAVRIIRSKPGVPVGPCTDEVFAHISAPNGEIGEIAVTGKHVLKGYADPSQNRSSKIEVAGTIWHRTGDAGYLDLSGRLWLVGRCSAAIEDERGTVYPFQVEYAVNAVRGIRRSALVRHQNQRVLVLETGEREFRSDCVAAARCIADHHVDRIVTVRRIPMDKRHGAKVDYPALQRKLVGRVSRVRLFMVEAVASVFRASRNVQRCLQSGLQHFSARHS